MEGWIKKKGITFALIRTEFSHDQIGATRLFVYRYSMIQMFVFIFMLDFWRVMEKLVTWSPVIYIALINSTSIYNLRPMRDTEIY